MAIMVDKSFEEIIKENPKGNKRRYRSRKSYCKAMTQLFAVFVMTLFAIFATFDNRLIGGMRGARTFFNDVVRPSVSEIQDHLHRRLEEIIQVNEEIEIANEEAVTIEESAVVEETHTIEESAKTDSQTNEKEDVQREEEIKSEANNQVQHDGQELLTSNENDKAQEDVLPEPSGGSKVTVRQPTNMEESDADREENSNESKTNSNRSDEAKESDAKIEHVGKSEVVREEVGLDDVTTNSESSPLLLNTFPTLKYGTAWKNTRTADLVNEAVHSGFRHIDTSNEARDFDEAGVGRGWTYAATKLGLTRYDFWIQTKFVVQSGHDPYRLPFTKDAPVDEQVKQSLTKSLQNLQTTYVDSYIMHGMENSWEKILLIWRTLESLVDEGKIRQIGVSKMSYDELKFLYGKARIKPAVVQNRFYAENNYDTDMRKFCLENNIEFQSFWTLGANRHALHNDNVKALAAQKGLTPETLMYAFVMSIGITPLDGTTSKSHMAEDIALLNRIRSGEKIFANEEELTIFAEALRITDWN